MSTPLVKGWCPGALRPMESGDGLIARLKITGGIVPLGLAAKIADWAARWGNGQIDLTQRANLQIRGLTPDGAAALQDAMAAEGLLDADPDGEAVRNVIASPLAGIDPEALVDIRPLVKALEARLAGDAALHALSAKFCFAVGDGGRFGLGDVRADIRFVAVPGPAFVVGFDGSDERFGPVAPEALVETAAALARAFIATGAKRMRALELSGIHALANASPLEGEVGNASALTGGGYGAAARLLGEWDLCPPPAAVHAASTSPSRGEAKIECIGVGLPFGRIAAGELAELAKAAADAGGSEIRLTPWRAVIVPTPSQVAAEKIAAAARTLNLILDPSDPRRRVAACVGAPACANATTAVRADAENLAQWVGEGSFLHVSGCAKGCAHPRPAPVTLVGRQGHYDLIRDDRPVLTGLTLDEATRYLREMPLHLRSGTA